MTNQRKAETTSQEYITVIQDLKHQAKKCMTQKSLRSDYKTISTKAPTTESTTISNTIKCTMHHISLIRQSDLKYT